MNSKYWPNYWGIPPPPLHPLPLLRHCLSWVIKKFLHDSKHSVHKNNENVNRIQDLLVTCIWFKLNFREFCLWCLKGFDSNARLFIRQSKCKIIMTYFANRLTQLDNNLFSWNCITNGKISSRYESTAVLLLI